MHRFRRVLPVLLLLFGLWQIGLPAQAQDNLLKNPGFEGTYGGVGTPDGWDGGSITSPRTESWMNLPALFFPHTADKAYEGTRSQNIGRGDATFSAGVWQKVDNIQAGTRLRFTAWVYLESQAGSNSRIRVGIDSNNYGSPLDDMTWSSYTNIINSWQEISVEATVPAGYVTVYVFATQDWPKAINQVYIDQASLKVVGTGQPITGPATAAPGSTGVAVVPVVPTTKPQVYAPSVAAQDKDASDGITHTVQSGDTLAAIAVAYGTTVTKIAELNGIDRRAMLSLGQKIIISKPSGGSSTTTDTQPTSAAPAATIPSETVAEPTKADTSAAQPTTGSQPTAAQPTSSGSALGAILGTPTQGAAAATTAAPAENTAAAATTAAPAENTAAAAPTTQPTDVPAPSATTAPTEAAALPTNTLAATEVAIAATPTETGVCVTLFEDKNQNRFQEETEAVLPGGLITLRDLQGKDVATHQTTADAKPFCFTKLTPATYNLGVVPPTGYGLTTTSALTVNVQVATQFQVNIGAAQGVTAPATPTLDKTVAQAVTDVDAASTSNTPLVLIFVGLIAVVAIGAGALIFVIRRL